MKSTWIIVTVRGRQKLTQRCLEALLQHTPGTRRPGNDDCPVRLFVIDNGSRDDTLEYLEARFRCGDIHRLLCNKAGSIPQWEKSYAICQAVQALRVEPTSEFIAWIDNDIVVAPGWLEAAQSVLQALPEVGVCSCHNDNTQERHHETFDKKRVGKLNVRVKATANGALWVMRQGFFDMYGLPPVGLGITKEGTEDWHYSSLLKERGIPFAVLDGCSKHFGYKDSLKREAIKSAG